jgi:hypothetical protein
METDIEIFPILGSEGEEGGGGHIPIPQPFKRISF